MSDSNHATTLLVDGIWQWPRRLEVLRNNLQANVGPCDIWKYDCSGMQPIDRLGGILAKYLDSQAEENKPLNIVAYSMGGLVARSAIAQASSPTVQRSVFVNVPHKGSVLAWGLNLPGTRQMRPGSPFLKELDAAPWEIPTLSIWTPGDAMVLPGSSARWEKADEQYRCDVPAHLWPIFSKRIHKKIAGFLNDHIDEQGSE